MTTTRNCPVCGKGPLKPRTYGRDMDHKGVRISVEGLQYDFCPDCDAEITSPAQMDHNAALVRSAFIQERARVKAEQHLLTGTAIRAIREQLGVTQKQAAKIFGGGPTAFSKYEAEDIVQSVAMDKLLRVAAAVPEAARWLVKEVGEHVSPQLRISIKTVFVEVSPFAWERTSRELRVSDFPHFEESKTAKLGTFRFGKNVGAACNEGVAHAA